MQEPRNIAKLRRWCIRKRGEGASVAEICTATQTPRRTFYNWWNRYQQHGPDALNPQSKRPPTIHRTSTETIDEIKTVRIRTGWCPHKIAGYLRTRGRSVGHMTVYRTLQASNLQPFTNQAQNQTNLQTMAKNAPQQPMAMRFEACRH